MLHELKDIINSYQVAKSKGIKTVLASVVALDGSSYRRPGVRMSIQSDNKMIGAVSGGCVEKEILRQSQSVFSTGTSKIMIYDGRYRLGCEGILYILIEPFEPNKDFIDAFKAQNKSRKSFEITSLFSKEEKHRNIGFSSFSFNGLSYSINKNQDDTDSLISFHQTIKPGVKLIIVGSEHDAVQLCKFAANAGWEVDIVAPPDDLKSIENFPGASAYLGIDEHLFAKTEFDSQTIVVFMTHSYVKDLKYLAAIRRQEIPYIGLLGPSKRRNKLITELFEIYEDVSEEFLENIYGPAGINIGAETPQEIAISIMSEALSVIRRQKPIYLKDKIKGIHQ